MADLATVLIRATDLFAKSLIILLVARVILSWIYPSMRNVIVFWVWRLTEPMLQPVRRMLPITGRMDWSPMIVIFLVYIARAVLIRFFYTWY